MMDGWNVEEATIAGKENVISFEIFMKETVGRWTKVEIYLEI